MKSYEGKPQATLCGPVDVEHSLGADSSYNLSACGIRAVERHQHFRIHYLTANNDRSA